MFKIAVCDDISAICNEVKKIILEIKEEIITGKIEVSDFYSGEELIEDINKNERYDLIFLDIEMDKINGLEVGHIIREKMGDYTTKIIYISSKSIYDRQLFDVQPFHFLKKPLDREKVVKDVLLAIKISNQENKSFEFKENGVTKKFRYSEILYFESNGRKVILTGTDGKYEFYERIEEVETRLPYFFIRPHRSYIVNYDFVRQFKYEELLMTNGIIIPVSRGRRKEVKDLLAGIEKKRL